MNEQEFVQGVRVKYRLGRRGERSGTVRHIEVQQHVREARASGAATWVHFKGQLGPFFGLALQNGGLRVRPQTLPDTRARAILGLRILGLWIRRKTFPREALCARYAG